MSDDDDAIPDGRRPASSSYSRGFVRGEATYVPGPEPLVGAKFSGVRLAVCLTCRTTWRAPDDQPGLVHPEFNRMGERCVLQGTWLWARVPVVRG